MRRRDDVRGVEPAAEPHFEDGDLDSRAPEQLERDRRGDLEERGLHLQPAVRAQAVDDVTHIRNGGDQGVPAHGPAVDDEPLRDVDQMRRRVARRAMARGAQRRVHHRRHRALAVGAGDMHRPERPLGMAEPRDERGNVVEAELDPELLQAEEVGQRILQGRFDSGTSRG